jgi:hypothetical protein
MIIAVLSSPMNLFHASFANSQQECPQRFHI